MSQSRLIIKDFKIAVHLGATPEERQKLQWIAVDAVVEFRELPPACQTDDLSGTINYADLCSKLLSYCQSQEFSLIEHLAFQAWQQLHTYLPTHLKFGLRVKKLNPPIENLQGGAIFEMGELSSWSF